MNPHVAELRRLDWFRRSPRRVGGHGGHKEWQHFLLHTDDLHLIVNFNLNDGPTGEVPRVIVLAFDGVWHGVVERLHDGTVDVEPGALKGTFGRNRLDLVDEGYRVRVDLPAHDIDIDLLFEPVTEPSQINNQPLGVEHLLNWLVVPRLRATGTARLGGVTHRLRAAEAYHDHNWGHFAWGADFCWEWGALLPKSGASPCCAVFSRLMNRSRTKVYSQGLLLWRGAKLVRLFRDREVTYRSETTWRAPLPFQLPPALSILAPGKAADLPAVLHVTGEGPDGRVALRATPRRLARVLIPSERDPVGLVHLNEVLCDVRLDGQLGGEPLTMEGRGVLEFIR